ncbi:MAG: hypothetical protein K2N95_13090 [Lachnospiraceae bacterium]|nr:hypothetical protein [Lachnospiraceae bacterium]
MREQKGFRTSLIPVILMISGLSRILGSSLLSALLGVGIYAAAVWTERIWNER